MRGSTINLATRYAEMAKTALQAEVETFASAAGIGPKRLQQTPRRTGIECSTAVRRDDENIKTKVVATEPGSAHRDTSRVESYGLGDSISDHDSATASRA